MLRWQPPAAAANGPLGETVPMKPRAIVWDLFGDHLRYVDDGRVPMRA